MPIAADDATMPFEPMPGLGQPEMQRIIAPRREHGIDADEVLHGAGLGRQDDLVRAHAEALRKLGAGGGGMHDGLVQHLARLSRLRALLVVVHHAGEQLLIEAAPVHADAHGLVVLQRDLDDVGELLVALVAEADIAGVDAVFRERLGAVRIGRQQLVADIVEIADERHIHAHREKPVADMRHGRRRLFAVHGDAHQLRTRLRERRNLLHGRVHIRGVGVRHRLHNDGRAPADGHAANLHRNGDVPRLAHVGHGCSPGVGRRGVCRST